MPQFRIFPSVHTNGLFLFFLSHKYSHASQTLQSLYLVQKGKALDLVFMMLLENNAQFRGYFSPIPFGDNFRLVLKEEAFYTPMETVK